MKDSIYVARFLVLCVWWFLTMCEILAVAISGENREHLRETLEEWRDRTADLLVADESARMRQADFFRDHTVGGILK